MLRSIRLVNFRSLSDTGDIELRPLIILLGANSSGKSTLLRFFPLLRQTCLTQSSSPLLWFGNDVDFGNFRQAVRGQDTSREIGVGMTLYDAPPLSVYSAVRCDENGKTYVSRLELQGGSDPTITPTATVGLDSTGALESVSYGNVDFSSIIAGRHVLSRGSLVPDIFPFEEETKGEAADVFREIDTHLSNANMALSRLSNGVRYVGPLRVGPTRYNRRQELAVEQVSSDGANLAMLIGSLSTHKQRELSEWTREFFGFGIRAVTEGAHVVLRVAENNETGVDLVDAGFGISQLLPVAAQAWSTIDTLSGRPMWADIFPPQIFAVEQPELHLHPRYQAQLADMFSGFIRAMKTQNRHLPVIVETHSEALVNRLGELICERRLNSADVSVLVFERDQDGTTQIRRVQYDDDGILQNWPLGFFLT